jgi:hypothetical protein
LLTIKDQRFEIEPDYRLDWREHFAGPATGKGHEVIVPDIWMTRLMPELLDLESRINSSTTRLLRVCGKARLSAWSAFGYVFSQVNGYTLEVDQNGSFWSTAVSPASDFVVESASAMGEETSQAGDTVVVGLSVSGDLEHDVRRDVAQRGTGIRALLLLRPNRELGVSCLRGAADAVALSLQAKSLMRNFAKCYQARRMLLYYFGPLAGAAFIGHQLNAVCPELQLMERIGQPDREYAEAFVLR